MSRERIRLRSHVIEADPQRGAIRGPRSRLRGELLVGVAIVAEVRALDEVAHRLAERTNLPRIGRVGTDELALAVGTEEAFAAFDHANLLILLRGSGHRATGATSAEHRARPGRQAAGRTDGAVTKGTGTGAALAAEVRRLELGQGFAAAQRHQASANDAQGATN